MFEYAILFLWNTIPFSTLFEFLIIPLRLCKIRRYRINSRETQSKIIENLSNIATTYIDDDKSEGYVIGRWYIAHISEVTRGEQRDKQLWIVTTERQFNRLKQAKTEESSTMIDVFVEPEKNIKVKQRYGHYYYLQHNTIELNTSRFSPKPKQRQIMDEVIGIFRSKGRVVCYISGEKGSGKSTLGVLLADELEATFTKQFNPTEPGDNLGELVSKCCPKKSSPLIIQIDEVDTIIHDIHEGKIQRHKDIPIMVTNKRSWNTFLDDFHLLYDNVILILTSNKSKSAIDSLDDSYLRENRVDYVSILNK
jgi:hypothetical protein